MHPDHLYNARRNKELAFRHSYWARHRARISAALNRLYPGDPRADAFDRCGTGAWIMVNPDNPDQVRVNATYCHDRFCAPCQRSRGQNIRFNLADFIKTKQVRLLTLTVASDDQPLAKMIAHLYHSFTALRRTNLWQTHVTGGLAVLEVKRSTQTPRWHPHLHVLIEGTYLEQGALTHLWHSITKTSFILDIRQAHRPDDTASYVVKYITKPTALRFTNRPELLDECIVAMRGRRTLLQFGTWYAIRLTSDPIRILWQPVAPLHEIITRAASCDPFALRLLEILEAKRQCHTDPDNQNRGPPASTSPIYPTAPVAKTPSIPTRGSTTAVSRYVPDTTPTLPFSTTSSNTS